VNDQDIVIVSAARTPIGKFQGAYKDLPATDLGASPRGSAGIGPA
jgi:acetyl-CoA acetyltransferase